MGDFIAPPSPQQIEVSPIRSYLAGQAMQIAYQLKQLQVKQAQQEIELAPKKLDYEFQLKQMEQQRLTQKEQYDQHLQQGRSLLSAAESVKDANDPVAAATQLAGMMGAVVPSGSMNKQQAIAGAEKIAFGLRAQVGTPEKPAESWHDETMQTPQGAVAGVRSSTGDFKPVMKPSSAAQGPVWGQPELDAAYQYYRVNGKPPPQMRGQSTQQQFWKYVAAKSAEVGDTATEINARASVRKAQTAELTQNEKLLGATENYAVTMQKNLDSLLTEYQKVGGSSSPVVNRAIRAWQTGAAGDPQTSKMIGYLNAVQNEYAKLASGTLGNIPASDSARAAAREVINQNMGQNQLEQVAEALKGEKENRLAAIRETSIRIKTELGSSGVEAPKVQTAPQSKADYDALPSGFTWTVNGKTYKKP